MANNHPHSDRREHIGVTIAGRYEAVSILGKGGMGIVYETRDTLLDRTVAIKTVPSFLENPKTLRGKTTQSGRSTIILR